MKNFVSIFFLLYTVTLFAQISVGNNLKTEGIAENSSGEIFVGTRGKGFGDFSTIYKSTDNGYNWIEIDSGFVDENPHVIKIAGNGYIFFTGYSTGVYRSTSNGNYWEPLNLFNYLQTDSYALLVSDNDYLFVGIGDNPPIYLARSTDYGENWTDLSGWVTERVYSLASYQNNIYAGTFGQGIYISTNYGNSWFQSSFDSLYISSLTVNDSGKIFAGGISGGLYWSTDNGVNWDEFSTPWVKPNCIASILIIEQHYLLVGLGRWLGVSDSNLIYKSTDSGTTWISSDSGISSNADAIHSLLFSSDLSIYATAWNGLYKSTDYGNSWFPIKQFITDAGTYETNLPVSELKLYQNHPNPFNPSTKIKYSIQQSSKIIIKIFDMLGNEIETLVDEEKQIGNYEITWYTAEIPSGVYFYQLQAGNFVETKKMVLLR